MTSRDEAARRIDDAGRLFADRCRVFGDRLRIDAPALPPKQREGLAQWIQLHADRLKSVMCEIPQLRLAELDDEKEGASD